VRDTGKIDSLQASPQPGLGATDESVAGAGRMFVESGDYRIQRADPLRSLEPHETMSGWSQTDSSSSTITISMDLPDLPRDQR
jgi:hypothetical protein